MAPRNHSKSESRSPSKSRSKSRSRTRSRSRAKSRSRSYSPRRSRSKTPNRRRSYSRSNSRSRSRSRRRSRSRSPLSHRKRHIGNREAPPPGKCLGVFGLSLYTTDREVREAFERYGRVVDCNVVHDHNTGRSRGFAFLNMSSISEAEDAKERMNGAELDGRRIRVDFSITQRAHTPTPGVYMGRPTQSSRYRGSNFRGYRRRSYSRSRSRSRSPYYR
ncbi:transformer-2 protein homolog alpha isoform X2 [Hydra vulgaris]|uniref:Transformer-2 protein homolog alpha isoform X2 n=1 Tax=Hydra vulgaris TaxID=6087 RepID=A0ABM4CWW3_HYDVU|nr:transformer-2 protein homolog alpha isoform X2 [Hydra vulgaris]